jgi:cyanophycin synthetase
VTEKHNPTISDITNKDQRRGHENVLTQIEIDRDSEDLLNKYGYSVITVPEKKKRLFI